MTTMLVSGANLAVAAETLILELHSASEVDAALYRLDASGKVRGDGDMVFYGQQTSDDGTVRYSGDERACRFEIQLPAQPAAIQRLALAFSTEALPAQLRLNLIQGGQILAQCEFSGTGRPEKALILGECYRRGDGWKFRHIAQGFHGGLKPLSEHFGVEISEDVAPAAASAPEPKINLQKITLDKGRPSVNLQKRDDFGAIRINLNWQRGAKPAGGGGFFKAMMGRSASGVDLDLGAFIRLRNGHKDCVQALGGRFGELERAPWIRLRADDRSGQIQEGEWLDVNGRHWADIDEILIYAFIYEGVPNWSATDAVVTLWVQGQEIVSHLQEGSHLGMCAIARLINDNGGIKVERLERYFSDHRRLDEAFGWGFNWTAGRK